MSPGVTGAECTCMKYWLSLGEAAGRRGVTLQTGRMAGSAAQGPPHGAMLNSPHNPPPPPPLKTLTHHGALLEGLAGREVEVACHLRPHTAQVIRDGQALSDRIGLPILRCFHGF